jgi:hypothetical protein
MRRIAITFGLLLNLGLFTSCGNDDPVTPPAGTKSFHVDGTWTCDTGVSCQDVYDFTFSAGSTVSIAVSAVTGNSVLRLSLFGPGVALDGVNLLMGEANDRLCTGQDEGETVAYAIATTGKYSLAVGRDWGQSAGADGTYSLDVTSATSFTVGTQTAEDTASLASGADCPFTSSFETDGSWDCGTGLSCQDVYDVGIEAGSELSITVTNVTDNSVARLALFAPGVSLDGTNLLTGSANDLSCNGQNGDESVVITVATTGVYRLAVARDWGQSAGASGNYRIGLVSTIPFLNPVQTVDDGTSAASGVVCPTTNYQVSSSWSCGSGVDCQDVYDLDLPAGASLVINLTGITGNSVPRLALFGPGSALSGTNLLNDSTNDRECVGQNINDSVAVVAGAAGVYRLAVGRDWGASAGATGNYTLTVTSSLDFVPLGRTVDNTASLAAGTQCP